MIAGLLLRRQRISESFSELIAALAAPGAGCLIALFVLAGCGRVPDFPVTLVQHGDLRVAVDVDGNGRNDYWQKIGSDGRKTELLFDEDGDGQPDKSVKLQIPPADDTLHVVIVLDGVPFEVVAQLYAQGRLRLLAEPSRLISVFPALTDVALASAYGAGPCLGYEAQHFDVRRNRLVDGNNVYLSGANAPWTSAMDYRCAASWDATSYLNPAAVWRHELDGFLRTIDAAERGTIHLYTVATAGLGTRGGRGAIREYLKAIDMLCEQVTYQRRGRIRFTLLADHGHGLTHCRRISLSRALRNAGFRVSKTLAREGDVVVPSYGLVTCAAIHTRTPGQVADVVLGQEGTDLVMYRPALPGSANYLADAGARADTSAIVVRGKNSKATIRKTGDRFIYDSITGDPLQLRHVLRRLSDEGKVGADGSVSSADWFEATATHRYPDPLRRIWCGLEAGCLVRNPADLLVSLKEGYACGSKFFAALCPVESTHGSLSRRSSTAFVMSNAVSLPRCLPLDGVIDLVARP